MTNTNLQEDQKESFFDRIGIPHSLRWGFLGVLLFMTGNGVEANFIAPHMKTSLGMDHAALVPSIIAMYSLAVMVASYLAGALSDLFGPRRIMGLGFLVWTGFEILFLMALDTGSAALILLSYFCRGFGFPLFAFAFLVWVNTVTPRKRNGAAVGWFYVMFTGGLPTMGAFVAFLLIPFLGGGYEGEVSTMWASCILVFSGFLLAWFGIRDVHGSTRLAPEEESASKVILSGLSLTLKEPKVLMGFMVRLINTAPMAGMFVILPAVIADDLGWGQSRWLLMTTVIYAGNILFNAAFGTLGDKWGWTRTVRWFGVVGSALGLLAWWYVPHMVAPGSDWGYYVSVAAGTVFGVLLAGFVPMGAIMPALVSRHKGAAMAMYTTAAGGAFFLGTAVVALVQPFFGNAGVVWAFVCLYGCAFVMLGYLKVDQTGESAESEEESSYQEAIL